jgi:type IV pilus assembly protein PilF
MHFHTRLLGALASAALLAGTPVLGGCATSAARAEQQDNARKAVSRLDLGGEHLRQGRHALALREFIAAERLDPKNPQIQRALGEAYLAQGKRMESELHYRRALELFPEFHDARLALSALYILEERYAESSAECEILVDDPTFAEPWRALANLGFAELKQGRLAEARKHLVLAREYRRDYWPATLSLAQVELLEGRRIEAIGYLQEVISLEPGPSVESEANYRIAEIYIALGQRQEAMGHLTTAQTKAPQGVWGRRSEEYLKLLR